MNKLVIWFAILFSLSFPNARGATIVVDTIDDDRFVDGDCSLLEAISAANDNIAIDNCPAGDPGEDTIDLTGIQGGIYLTGALPQIIEDLTITGPGEDELLIHANGTPDTIFRIGRAGQVIILTVNISGLKIAGGDVVGKGGAFILHEGGTLNLSSSTLDNNSASREGGAIHNFYGTVTLTDCIISGNSAGEKGGGIYNNHGTVTLTDCTVRDNSAGTKGGGIANTFSDSILVATRITVIRNEAGTWGGGISNAGELVLAESTVNQNRDSSGAGGINNEQTANLTNTTLSGNVGNGFRNAAGDAGVSATFTNCTVAFNGGGGLNIQNPATLINTIVANNTLYDCSAFGTITSLGHNLDSDDTCSFTGPGDLPGARPRLAPLRDNGGPTLTHALVSGSPAIDAGDNAGCPASDQRGITRPQDGDRDGSAICDIGAYEALSSEASGAMPWIPLLLLDD